MKEAIIRILRENAGLKPSEIAARLGCDEASVHARIAELEKDKIIIGNQTLLNEATLPACGVMAIIEVKVRPEREGGFDRIARRLGKFPEVTSLYLMSGGFDLQLVVRGDSLQEVAAFVSNKLATIDGVISTTTHFLLKKYKEAGILFEDDNEYERLKISP